MPNQRSKNKVRLGGFINSRLYRQIVSLSRKEGMADDKFGFAQKLIHESMAYRRKSQGA